MKKIITITFPHSGQHLLIWVLEKYFSRNLDFPKHDPKKVISAGEFYACQRGGNNHCDTFPCSDLRTTYQATHNDRDIPLNNPKINYIFQYRHPINSIIGLIGWDGNKSDCQLIEEMITHLAWWREWVHYFLLSSKGENVLKIFYDTLVNNPIITLNKVIEFIEPQKEVDLEFLELVIEKQDINFKHKITDYNRCKPHFKALKALEKLVTTELELLNIPKINWE